MSDPQLNQPRSPQPASEIGTELLKLTGMILMPIGWLCGLAGMVMGSFRLNGWIVLLLVFFTIVFNIGGRYLYKLGRQKEAKALNVDLGTVLRNQQGESQEGIELSFLHWKPYTLYLRAFGVELETNEVDILTPQGGVTFSFVSPEEAVSQALAGIAPGVAIGKPGDKYPPRGMQRLYVEADDDEKWRQVVIEGMKHANLVVIRAPEPKPGHAGDGLWWEIEQSAKHVRPERLLILLPFATTEADGLLTDRTPEYNAFRKEAEKYWPCRLPDYYGVRTTISLALTGLLYFSADWTPHIASLASIRIPPLRKRANNLAPAMKIALKPVYQQLGVRWTPPPLTEWIIIALCLLAAPFLLMIIGGLLFGR